MYFSTAELWFRVFWNYSDTVVRYMSRMCIHYDSVILFEMRFQHQKYSLVDFVQLETKINAG